MNVTLTTPRNFNRIKEFTNSLPQTIRLGVCHGLNETGREMVKHTRKKMRSGPFTGRTYRIRGRLHIASATGEYPHTITGRLSRSINYKTYGSARLEYGSTEDYAKFLEEGTSKMGARKFLFQTAKLFDKQVEVNIEKRVNIQIQKQNITVNKT
mgnify:FL=1